MTCTLEPPILKGERTMKQVRVPKMYGVWFYEKEHDDDDMEFAMYKLYDADGRYVESFGYYMEMVYFIMDL